MRAAQLPKPGEDIVIVDLSEPSPGPGQVVIKMAAAGVCHSDLTFQVAGPGMPTPPSYPWTMGHENAGYVHALGEGVDGLTEGTRWVFGRVGGTPRAPCAVRGPSTCAPT